MLRLYDFQNDFYRLRPIPGAVDDDPVLFRFFDELLDVSFEMLDDLGADGVSLSPALLPIGQGFEGDEAALCPSFGIGVEGDLQGFVGEGGANSGSEVCHGWDGSVEVSCTATVPFRRRLTLRATHHKS